MLHPPTIELGGQTRTLVCDMGAWAKLQDMGFKVREVTTQLTSGGEVDFRVVRALLVATLWKDNVTPEQASEWVTGDNWADVMRVIGLSLRHAFGEAEASEEPNPPTGTGKRSSNEVLTPV